MNLHKSIRVCTALPDTTVSQLQRKYYLTELFSTAKLRSFESTWCHFLKQRLDVWKKLNNLQSTFQVVPKLVSIRWVISWIEFWVKMCVSSTIKFHGQNGSYAHYKARTTYVFTKQPEILIRDKRYFHSFLYSFVREFSSCIYCERYITNEQYSMHSVIKSSPVSKKSQLQSSKMFDMPLFLLRGEQIGYISIIHKPHEQSVSRICSKISSLKLHCFFQILWKWAMLRWVTVA